MMNNMEFVEVLKGAVSGSHEDLEIILELYEPMIRRYSFDGDIYDEDLHQYLLIHIALNINKFKV